MVRSGKNVRIRKACSVTIFPKFLRFFCLGRRPLRGALGRVSRINAKSILNVYVDEEAADVYKELVNVDKKMIDVDQAANDFDQEVAEKTVCVDEKGADVDDESTDVYKEVSDIDKKVVDVDQGEAEKAGDADQQVPFAAPKLDNSKLVIEELKMGYIGNHHLKADFGSKVSVTCEYKSEGGVLRMKHHDLELGSGTVIRELHEGIRGMSLGDKRRLHIPSSLQSGGRSICEVTLTKVH